MPRRLKTKHSLPSRRVESGDGAGTSNSGTLTVSRTIREPSRTARTARSPRSGSRSICRDVAHEHEIELADDRRVEVVHVQMPVLDA